MMRITEVSRSESVCRFQIEGRLTQLTAAELLGAVEAPLLTGRTVLLDLAAVTFADSAGADTLARLRQRGVVLTACSGFLSEMLRVDRTAERRGGRADDDTTADTRFLDRLRRGDEAAFAELVERNAGRMLAAAKRLLRSEDDARDAVQDAFVSAFKNLASFNGDAKLSTWLHRIVVNAALMKLRSRKHRAEQSIDDLLPRFDEEGTWAQAPRAAVSSLDLLESRETRVVVRRCIDRLPDTYRTVLLMRDIEDLDTEEAAEILGITANAVKIRLHRARQALRTLLERELSASHLPAHRDGHPAVGASEVSGA